MGVGGGEGGGALSGEAKEASVGEEAGSHGTNQEGAAQGVVRGWVDALGGVGRQDEGGGGGAELLPVE